MSQLVMAYLLGVLTTPLVSLIVLWLLDRATRRQFAERLSAQQMQALDGLRWAVQRGQYDDDLVGDPISR